MRPKALTAIAVLICSAAPVAYAQTLDGVLAKAGEAMGGAAAFAAIETMRITGSVEVPSQDMVIDIVQVHKRPNKMKRILTLFGSELIQAYDGKDSWMISPDYGPDPRPGGPGLTTLLKRVSDIDQVFFNMEDKGVEAKLLENITEGESELNQVEFTYPDGFSEKRFFDAGSGRMCKTLQNRGGNIIEVRYSDYRQVGDIRFPFLIEERAGDATQSALTVKSVEINVPIDDSEFEMPSPAKP